MVNYSNALLIALCAAIISADSNCGNGQEQIISGAQPDQVTVCCPGVMKAKNNNGYCCIGGTNDDCGKTTCFDDMSSCKALINVHDSSYVKEIEDAAGVKPRRPGHPDDSDAADSGSGSNSSSTSSSSSGEFSSAGTAAFFINTATATDSPNAACSDSAPVTASNSQSPSFTVSNSISATDTGAAGNNSPVLGLFCLAIVPALMYDLQF